MVRSLLTMLCGLMMWSGVTTLSARAEKPCGSQELPLDDGWFFHAGEAVTGEAPPVDDAGWVAVRLPHDWAIAGPRDPAYPSGGAGGFAPMGVGWYRRALQFPEGACKRKVMVRFDGIMAHSDVYLNGQHVGSRPNGYVSLQYDLSPYLSADGSKPQELLVRADNHAQPSSRFYQGAGLYRHVHLSLLPALHTAAWSTVVRAAPPVADRSSVVVETMLVNDGAAELKPAVRIAVKEKGSGRVVATFRASAPALAAHTQRLFTAEMHLPHPQLWDLDHPNLYRAELTLLGSEGSRDTEDVSFGVRDMHFEAATGFWLNGRNVKIKGVALHSDLGALGMAAPRSLVRHRLLAMKGMGANAIRTAHNPVDPAFLDQCDELGLLVLDEYFDVWTVGKNPYDYHLDFREWYLRDLRDSVDRDRNHPSIFAWSAGNEIHDTPHPEIAKPILASLVEAYHEEDPTRPVTQALFRPNVSHDYEDGLADMLDVIGQNYRPNEILAAHEAKPTRKILGTENIHDRATWLAVRDHPAYSGMFVWSGTDYLGESRHWPLFADASGLFDRTDFAKPDAMEHESWWSTQPVVHVVRRVAATPKAPTDPGYELQQYRPAATTFHDWTPAGAAGHEEHVEVYSNCKAVRLSLNGKNLGDKQLPADAAARTWDVPFAPGLLKAECVESPSVADTLRTAGPPAALQLRLETQAAATGFEDMALARAVVVDAAGTPVPGSTARVTFAAVGPARVVATDDADTVYHAPFESQARDAYDGRVVAYVERTGPGGIRISAESPGLTGAVLEMDSRSAAR